MCSSTFGHESFTSNKNRRDVRLCFTWGETAYRLVFPESWYDEVPETKDTNGLKDVLHLWVFNGFQKLGDLGDWKNLNTSISLLYSGFLAFSRLYFQHSHPNEVQKMQLLATYVKKKNMKKHLIAASQNTEHPRLNGSRSL